MRNLYQQHWIQTITLGHDLRVVSDRVWPGHILAVHYCYFHIPDAAKGDIATILLDNGGDELVIRSRARDAAKQGMSAIRPFHVGEHRRVIGYAPQATNGHTISLSLCGELLELKRWRKGKV